MTKSDLMSCNVGQYINDLIVSSGCSQAEVARRMHIPRQLLSYVICGKREISLQLAMKLESYFSLPDGELMKMQAEQAVRHRKKSIRQHLCDQLIARNAFWSYDVKSPDDIPDEELIEKTFTILDMDDIALMFEIFPLKFIRKVWQERMAIQGDYMRMLNIMIAMYYFGIKQPEKYLSRLEHRHIRNILKESEYASGINC